MRGTPYVFGDFRGGLNTKANAYLVEQTQCRDATNVQSTTAGAIVKRFGTRTVGNTKTSPSIITSPKTIYAAESLSTDTFIIASAAQIGTMDTAGTVAVSSAASTNGYWSVVETTPQSGQGPVFMSNGTNTPLYFDGTNFGTWTADSSSTATLPNGKYLTIHENRIFSAGASNPSALYWSEVQVGVGTLPCRWNQENIQLFDPNDGDEITGLGKVGSNLAIFKKHKVFILFDSSTGASRRLTDSVGCIASRSIVETPMGLFFLSDKGVYVTNGGAVELISDQITPTIEGLINPELCTAIFYKNHYYLSCPSSGIILDYDLVLKSWWKHTVAGTVNDFCRRFNGGVEECYLVTEDQQVGQWLAPNVYTDFGSVYQWSWKGPWITPGEARVLYPAVRKRLKALRVDGAGYINAYKANDFYETESIMTPQKADGTASTELFNTTTTTTFGGTTYFGDYDSSTTPATTYSTIFGDISPVSQSRIWGQGVARSWAFTFKASANDTGSSAVINNYTVFTQERHQ